MAVLTQDKKGKGKGKGEDKMMRAPQSVFTRRFYIGSKQKQACPESQPPNQSIKHTNNNNNNKQKRNKPNDFIYTRGMHGVCLACHSLLPFIGQREGEE